MPPGEKKWITFYYIQYNFATCAHNRLFSTLLIGTDGKYRQHCSINKVLMSIGHIISYMFFCSPYARRLGFHGKTNALMWLLILLLHYFGAHSKNEHHWEQFDGEGKKISGGIGGRKSAPVLDRCYTLLHVSFTYVYMYLSSIVLY